MLLKSNSSNNLNSKPRVKIVDEIFPPRPKGGSEQTSKNVEPSPRTTSRSTLFKSSSLGRSSAIESKVKMLSPKSATTQDLKGSRHLKESGALDRKYLSRNDRHVASSAVSTPKGDQKLTPRGEAIIKPSAVNNRELKINQDGKLNAPSKSMNNVSRKSLEPQGSSGVISEKHIILAIVFSFLLSILGSSSCSRYLIFSIIKPSSIFFPCISFS